MLKARVFGLAAGLLLIGAGLAAAAAEDKRQYTLLNPTPAGEMREMSTDRPDTTESPYSVDAGHFQFELSFVEYGHDDEGGTETERWGVMPSNIKVGLLHNTDIQFVFTPYEHVETTTAGVSDTDDGFSDDTQIRLKVNLWGNEGDTQTAFAIMPFIKFPTGSGDLTNDHLEGGIILPLAVALPRDFSLGLMAEVDFVYNDATGGYGVDLVHTATIGHPIAGKLSGYIEYIGIAPNDTGVTYQSIGSGGFTYEMSENWILDFGGTVGLSDSAEDFTLFAGTSFRI